MKRENRWFYMAVSIIYMSLAAAVIFGLYITKSPICLLAFLLVPEMTSKDPKETKKGNGENDNISYWS